MRKHPPVVFLDSYSWQAFLDLAGALTHRDVEVVRITGRSSSPRVRFMQRVESLVFGSLHRLVDGGVLHRTTAVVDPAALAAAVPASTVDVHMQEDLAEVALTLPGSPANPAVRLGPGVDPRILLDKRLQVEHARALGIAVPAEWPGPDSPAYPVVVKTAVGFGGGGVRIVEDAAALAEAWEELSKNGAEPYLQERLDRGVSTGGVALHGEPLVCVAYDGRPAPGDPTGPAHVVVAVEADEAVAQTAAFLRSIGYTGFFCLDWVQGADGRPRLIDVNARVFGSWAALQELGFDLIGAYLHAIGAADAPAPASGRYGEPARLLRYPCPPARSHQEVLAWRAETLEVVRARRAFLGGRWAAVIRIRTALGTLRGLVGVARRRGAGPSYEAPAAAPESSASAA